MSRKDEKEMGKFINETVRTPHVLHVLLQTSDYDYLAICLLKWAIKCELNMIITGGMGTGKTTLLKSILRYADNKTFEVDGSDVEMNLTSAYPDKTVVVFEDEPNCSDYDEKEVEDAAIIFPEITNGSQASWYIRRAASTLRCGLATHYAQNTCSLIDAVSNSLLESGACSDKNKAIRETLKGINFDCHVSRTENIRYIEYISEVIPSETAPYFKVQKLIKCKIDDTGEKGHYEIVNLPSDLTIKRMKSNLSEQDKSVFDQELKYASLINGVIKGRSYEDILEKENVKKDELDMWINKICSL